MVMQTLTKQRSTYSLAAYGRSLKYWASCRITELTVFTYSIHKKQLKRRFSGRLPCRNDGRIFNL
jgi:hypothetical protein